MDKKNLKDKVCTVIQGKRDYIIKQGEEFYSNPETGFKEFVTSRKASGKFRELGLECRELDDITGFRAEVDTGRPGPGIALLAELDSVICPEHPDSSMETGAVHACGHNAQMAAVLGAAIGLLQSDAFAHLCGKVSFIYVPAEEYIETQYRINLREKGIIRYLGGKPEFIYRGMFDGVDLSFMFHIADGDKKVYTNSTCNGCIVKDIRYLGKAAHAGASPHNGINALYAANLGLSAVNAIRETFREEQYIRVHPIITKGGDIVNAIPSDVRISTFVRGKTLDDIAEANQKVNRAFAGTAAAMGAQVKISDLPGYLPLSTDRNLMSAVKSVMEELVQADEIGHSPHTTGSTDMGDVSSIMPAVHPYIGGMDGGLHRADFKITDPDTAYVLYSKILACTAVELLFDRGEKAVDIVSKHKPVFKSAKDYLEYADSLFSVETYPKCDCWK